MPLVVVNKGNCRIPKAEFDGLISYLPVVVATALTTYENPDGKLKPADVEVWVHNPNSHDVGSDKVQIVIFANLYPERAANLDERRKQITRNIRKTFPSLNIYGWVWILLAPGSFGEF